MRINIGKWLRRQVFGGEPVTLRNAGRVVLNRDRIRDAVERMAEGRAGVDEVVAAIEAELRELEQRTRGK